MRTILSGICLVTICSVAAIGAQTKPEQPAKSPDAPMTVVGCVAPATAAGQFQLTNAMMASPMAQQKADEKSKASAGSTYMLTGGENLKAHVGHKVEVTGTLSKSMEKPATDKPAMPGEKADMVRGTLAVTAVKMVSTTCP